MYMYLEELEEVTKHEREEVQGEGLREVWEEELQGEEVQGEGPQEVLEEGLREVGGEVPQEEGEGEHQPKDINK